MRKLKLQVQMSVDGHIADPHGKTDWMLWDWGEEWNWDDELKKYYNDTFDSVDSILLSRKMAEGGFISHWVKAAENPNDSRFAYAKKINDTHKVVFTKTWAKSDPKVTGWKNIDLANGDLAEEVNRLKKKEGKDIIVYGGANFGSNLIEQNLIDEIQLFVNPVAIGEGMKIFNKGTILQLEKSILFSCGINVLIYRPAKK